MHRKKGWENVINKKYQKLTFTVLSVYYGDISNIRRRLNEKATLFSNNNFLTNYSQICYVGAGIRAVGRSANSSLIAGVSTGNCIGGSANSGIRDGGSANSGIRDGGSANSGIRDGGSANSGIRVNGSFNSDVRVCVSFNSGIRVGDSANPSIYTGAG
ncbi:MAG: hypothetical protein FWH55_04645 [Oscillospiraceae bacterium]|nr:hypothetical protein [Oscillospiraceae bacterium]